MCVRAGDVGFSVFADRLELIGDALCSARLTDLPQTKEDVQGIAYTWNLNLYTRESRDWWRDYS